MSGTSRLPSPGTPVPDCQLGFANIVLAPPPPALNPLVLLSFQAASGIYDKAVPVELVEPQVPSQKVVAPAQPLVIVAAPSPLNWLPPTPVTSGMLAGTSTARPWVAEVPVSQSAAPVSPEGPLMVCPCALASWAHCCTVRTNEVPRFASQLP